MTGWASFGVSLAALVASLVALQKSYLAPAAISVIAGVLRLRVYRYESDEEAWFVPAFHVTLSFTNAGARAGRVDGLRLRVTYVGIDPPTNFETFVPVVHLKESLGLRTDSRADRDSWLDTSPEWSAFMVLSKETVTQHLIFQASGWHRPVRTPLKVALEVHTSESQDWRPAESWDVALNASAWGNMERGSPWPGYSQSYVDTGDQAFPPDLPARRDSLPAGSVGRPNAAIEQDSTARQPET